MKERGGRVGGRWENGRRGKGVGGFRRWIREVRLLREMLVWAEERF